MYGKRAIEFGWRAVCVVLLAFGAQGMAAKKANVILIITDDQGYGDIGVHGNTVVQTPNMDRLHSESVRFTNFHVDPTCAPTRGALMSGKYSHRAKVWHTIAGGNSLRAGELTMAEVFKASGYQTAMFGKWHLGSNYPYRPMDRGFEEWLGQGDGGTGTTDDYFTNDRVNDHYYRNGEFEYIEGYAPDVFYDEAIDYIRDRGNELEPFFVYLSTYIPHAPHTLADPAWADGYRSKVDSKVAYFFAAIERVDQGLGRLRSALVEEGLADDTIVIFMSDNGGTAGSDFFNAGMRGKKGTVYDGGHRVPFFFHWGNGKVQHGKDVGGLNAHIDVLPSLIDLLDLTVPDQTEFDGRSFRKQLFQPDVLLPERTVCVEKQRTFVPHKWEEAAAMTQRWRLVNGEELYDIPVDPGQVRNVYSKHPEVVAQLKRDFDAYWRHVMPGDRDRAVAIVGHETDPETFLHSADWYVDNVPWNHAATSRGAKVRGTWKIRAQDKGDYRFEVRRWRKETNGTLIGIPNVSKKVDAWDSNGPKVDLIYGSGKSNDFRALLVVEVRLRVGDREWVRRVGAEDVRVDFDVPLDAIDYEVAADLLDEDREILAGAYYVYCRKVE